MSLAVLATEVVDNLSQDASEETICPFSGSAVEVPYRASLDMTLESMMWQTPSTPSTRCIACRSIFQAADFPDPDFPTIITPWWMLWIWYSCRTLVIHVSLSTKCCSCAILPNGLRELLEVGRNVFHAREDLALGFPHHLNILSDQLRCNCFADDSAR